MPETVITKPEPRASTLVVTGETRQAFMDHRMDIAKPEPAPVVVVAEPAKVEPVKVSEPAKAIVEEATTLEAELKAEEEKPQPDEKKKQTIRERISQINEKKKASDARADAAEARAAKAEKEAAELRTRAAPPAKVEEPGAEPQRAQFQSDDEYLNARVDYTVAKREAAREKAQAEARAKAESDRVVQTYSTRLAATKAETPDFDARIEKAKDLPISPHIRDAIFESEVGPKMALYFADHPEEATRLNGLSANAALREFGKIESMIETAPAKPAPVVVAPVAAVSKAPPPISPIKATSGEPEVPIDSSGKFTGSYAEYKNLRKQGKIR